MNTNIAKGNWQRLKGAGITPALALTLIAAGFGSGVLAATPSDVPPAGAATTATPPPETGDRPVAPTARKALRFRLDDGRYQGFHQDDPDQLRSNDRITVENDRIQQQHRALKNEGAGTP